LSYIIVFEAGKFLEIPVEPGAVVMES